MKNTPLPHFPAVRHLPVFVLFLFAIPTLFPAEAYAGDAPPASPPNPELDPAVLQAIDAMGVHLRSLQAFTVDSKTSTDEVLDDGQKLQFDRTVRLEVRRPDRLHARIESDRKHRELFYDGRTFTLYGRRANYYASVDAPATLRELIATLTKLYGIELPLADLFLWGTEGAGTAGIQGATALGPATVEGVACQHYAIRQEGLDWQIWVQTGAMPLPRKLVITTTSEPSQPQHQAVLTWNTSPQLDDAVFTFSPPRGARKIPLQTVDGTVAMQR